MKITTTKNLKGVLEIPSLGIQLAYDHNNGKSQTRHLDDKYYGDSDIQTAANLKLITISKTSKKKKKSYLTGNELIKLVNKTDRPLMIGASTLADSKQIPAQSFLILPSSILENPHVRNAVDSGKLEIQDADALTGETKTLNLDLDLDVPEDDTTAVVANPNEEKTPETEQSIKKVDATKAEEKKDDTDSEMRVYSPDATGDEEEEDADEIEFVDKEQEKERLKMLPKKTEETSDTEAVQSKKLEGTTPVVIQRKMKKVGSKKKAAKKKTTKKTSSKKKTSKKKTVVAKKEEAVAPVPVEPQHDPTVLDLD